MIASTLISPGGRFKAIRRKLKYFPIIESSYLLHFHAYTQLPCSYLTPCFNLILASQNALNLIPSCLFYDFPIANTLSPLPPFSLFTTSLTSSYKNTEISPIKKKKNPSWILLWRRYMAFGYNLMCYIAFLPYAVLELVQ